MLDKSKFIQHAATVFQQNVGNRITPELANGMIAAIAQAYPDVSIEDENGIKVDVDNPAATPSDEPANSKSTGASKRSS